MFFKWNIRNNPKIQSEFYHCQAVGPTLGFWFQHWNIGIGMLDVCLNKKKIYAIKYTEFYKNRSLQWSF